MIGVPGILLKYLSIFSSMKVPQWAFLSTRGFRCCVQEFIYAFLKSDDENKAVGSSSDDKQGR